LEKIEIDGIRGEHKGLSIIRKIQHPSIIQIKGIYKTKESLYVCMPLLNELKQEMLNKYTNNDKKKILKQIAIGILILQTLPEPVMHRDVKLDNILISENPLQACLSDFSITAKADLITQEKTPPDISPPESFMEEYKSASLEDKLKFDIYSFGKLMANFNLEELQDIIQLCLNEDPKKRINIIELCSRLNIMEFSK